MFVFFFFFFFSSRRRHTRLQGDWSSDVCSSDLLRMAGGEHRSLVDDVGAIADAERLANVMIRYEHADAALLEEPNDALDVEHRDRADDHVEAGGLAGAVRAEQSDHLAAADLERHVLHHGARLVALAQALRAQAARAVGSCRAGLAHVHRGILPIFPAASAGWSRARGLRPCPASR